MLYGAGAYTGTQPIGGGQGFISEFKESDAKYIIDTLSDLTLALSSVKSGEIIWIPHGVTISTGAAAYGKALKSGAILASDGTGMLKSTYDTSAFMPGLIVAQSYSRICGVIFEGVRGLGKVGPCGQCAILGSYAKGVIVENVIVRYFPGGGVYFYHEPNITQWDDDNQRNIVRNSHIHNIQRHGYGYGVGVQGGTQSVLVEACRFGANRHSVMNAGGEPSYEVRYCIFEDSTYNTKDDGTGTWYGSHQVDSHGGGYYGFKAGTHLRIHHNTFSRNNSLTEKPNICIRGKVSADCIIEYNLTAKPRDTDGAYSDSATAGNNRLVLLAGEEGGPWDGPSSSFSIANVTVRDNWYGELPEGPDPPDPPVPSASIKCVGMSAPTVVLGKEYAVTATIKNEGDSEGSENITIGYLRGGTEPIALYKETVTLDAGASKDVTHTGNAAKLGDWTFYCLDQRVVLSIVEEHVPAPSLAILGVTSAVQDKIVSVQVVIQNTGDAAGIATVTIGGQTKQANVGAGNSEPVLFSLPVALST